jgi:hypothetical protein
MVLNLRQGVKWLFLTLPLLAVLLISPLPPPLAKSSMPVHTPQLALKCLVGSICGDVVDLLPSVGGLIDVTLQYP